MQCVGGGRTTFEYKEHVVHTTNEDSNNDCYEQTPRRNTYHCYQEDGAQFCCR